MRKAFFLFFYKNGNIFIRYTFNAFLYRTLVLYNIIYLVLPYKPNISLIHSILSCKLFVYICKFLYLYTIILVDIYA